MIRSTKRQMTHSTAIQSTIALLLASTLLAACGDEQKAPAPQSATAKSSATATEASASSTGASPSSTAASESPATGAPAEPDSSSRAMAHSSAAPVRMTPPGAAPVHVAAPTHLANAAPPVAVAAPSAPAAAPATGGKLPLTKQEALTLWQGIDFLASPNSPMRAISKDELSKLTGTYQLTDIQDRVSFKDPSTHNRRKGFVVYTQKLKTPGSFDNHDLSTAREAIPVALPSYRSETLMALPVSIQVRQGQVTWERKTHRKAVNRRTDSDAPEAWSTYDVQGDREIDLLDIIDNKAEVQSENKKATVYVDKKDDTLVSVQISPFKQTADQGSRSGIRIFAVIEESAESHSYTLTYLRAQAEAPSNRASTRASSAKSPAKRVAP